MKRPVKQDDGKYHIDGSTFKELFGSREKVMHGTAYKTPGGLKKKDLFMNKWGRIVSLKKHKTAKKEKRLQKYGFFAQKGKFGYVKRTVRKNRVSRKAKSLGGNDGEMEKPEEM
jgi:hypothetical protein